MLRYFLCMALFVGGMQLLQGQKNNTKKDEPDNNIEKYLDDGRIGNVKNLIRLRVNPTVCGYMGASYERKFTRTFGLEAGAYVKVLHGAFIESFRYTGSTSSNTSLGYDDIVRVNSGMGVLVYPKLYFTGKSINNGYFFGLRTFMTTYSADKSTSYSSVPVQKGVKAQSLAAYLMVGSHQHFGSRFTWGFEWGGGFYNDQYKNVDYLGYDSNFAPKMMKKNMSVSNLTVTADLSFGFLF